MNSSPRWNTYSGLGGVVVRTLTFNLLNHRFEYQPGVAQNNASPKKCMGMQNFARELAIFCIPLQNSVSPCKIMYFFCFDTWEKNVIILSLCQDKTLVDRRQISL